MTRNALAILGIAAACSGKAPPLASSPGTVGPGSAAAPAPPPAVGSASAPSAPSAPPGVPGVKVTLADVGLEASSLDRTVDPCVDFYQFACGGWLQNNPVPPDRARWSRRLELDARTKGVLKNLLEESAKGINADAATKKLGDFYASCMDQAALEKTGLAGIKPVLDRAQQVANPKTWMAALTELHRLGIWVVWSAQVAPDRKDSANSVVYLDAAGLGLPDRDYYVKPELKDKLDAYKQHVGRLLGLAGVPPGRAEAAAGEVVAIETELAKLMHGAAEQHDLAATYNPSDAAALARQVKSVDWKAYWKALDAAPSKKLVVATPKLFGALDRLRAKFRPAQWASYFTYHAVIELAHALPKAIGDEAFELDKVLTGVETQRDRTQRCIDATELALGDLLGQKYVAQYFPGSSQKAALQMIDALVRAMHDDLGGLDWMTEPTRAVAQQKLAKVVRMVGYPEKWRTYDYDVRRDDFAGNVLRAAAFETHRNLMRAGKPVDRTAWEMPAYRVDAFYLYDANTTVIPAGILQPPYFGADHAVAANLGGIGTVIGHELTHGFDDQGAQFDGDANLKDWWQKDDAARFADKRTCLAEQYSTFEALPKLFVDGKLTLGENIADLGGVKLAFQAYRALRKDAAKTYVADGFTEDQQFFLAAAQGWCSRERPAELQRRLVVDNHAPPKFRIYGSLRNLKEFAEAFSCAPGTPMRPAKTCSVW